jgi:hypothetical protein
MRKTALLYLAGSTLFLAAMLLWLAANPKCQEALQPGGVLASHQVKGMALQCGGLLYTLNFAQQNQLMALLNLNSAAGLSERVQNIMPGAEELIVYRFAEGDSHIPLNQPHERE